ncbi:MAG: tyrosine-type recombinase/integrase [Mesorhizobium sp.]
MAKLTESLARKTVAPDHGQKLLFDDKEVGFGVRITPTARSWIVQINQHRQSKRVSLGKVGEMSMADAKFQAKRLKLAGLPATSRKGKPKSVADLWARLVKDDAHRLRPGTKRVYLGYWTNWIEPAIGKKTLDKVTSADVSELLGNIPGAVLANRVHELLRRLLASAVDHSWLAKNPAQNWKRRHEVPRENYLSPAELERLFAALPSNEVGDALRLAALTGARIGEVLAMGWDQLRDDDKVWLKPATTTKQRKSHLVPLVEAAQLIVARQPRRSRGGFVFSRAEDGRAVASTWRSWHTALKRAELPKTTRVHDLRHSFASLMISGGASLAVVGAALGHSQPQTTQRYAHLSDATLREAMEKAANVIPMRKAG